MFPIFILQVIIVIGVGFIFYNKGYSAGEEFGREDEASKYKDKVKVVKKEVVVEDD